MGTSQPHFVPGWQGTAEPRWRVMLSQHYLHFNPVTLESCKHLHFLSFIGYFSACPAEIPQPALSTEPSSAPAPGFGGGAEAGGHRHQGKGQGWGRLQEQPGLQARAETKTSSGKPSFRNRRKKKNPKAVLHFYRFIWILKPSPKTGRTQRGNYFLLIKRMKRPNIDFVLHHHTKNLPTTARMTV